jgi:c-di-GMP-binding flagellar brake protein YcgR
VPLRDISEKGFSFKLPKTIYLELNKPYSGELNINDKSLPIVFKVLYKTERPDNTYRYGAKILNVAPKVEDEVAKYIFERQRKITKILNTFAD